MEFQRSRNMLGMGLFLLVGGIVIVGFAMNGWRFVFFGSTALYGVGVLSALTGVWAILGSRKPFRFRVDENGLTLRLAGLNGLVPWAQIAAIIVEPPMSDPVLKSQVPQIVLVPAPGVDLGVKLRYHNALDDRLSLVLAAISDVREPADQVIGALARYAGDRMIDVSQPKSTGPRLVGRYRRD